MHSKVLGDGGGVLPGRGQGAASISDNPVEIKTYDTCNTIRKEAEGKERKGLGFYRDTKLKVLVFY